MFGPLLAMVMFRVVPIALPASYGPTFFDADYGGHAAIGANGSVAVELKKGDYSRRIGIVRPNGTTTYLPLPSPSLIGQQIEVEAPAHFSNVELAADGTPFVTVSSGYEAVGGGSDRHAYFVWTGSWHALPHPGGALDLTAAYALGSFAFDNDDGSGSDGLGGSYTPSRLVIYRDGRSADLGPYRATSLDGRYLSATQAYPSRDPSDNETPAPNPTPTPVPQAIVFDGATMKQLGPGYASAVNADGDVVGDDEPGRNEPGRPTLWTHGAVVTLAEANGRATAINDAGLIVGMAGTRFFVTDAHDPQHRLFTIDDLLKDRTWHVTEAYGIANDGRILVTARQAKGPKRLVLLEPVRR